MDLFNLAAKLTLDGKDFTNGLKKADKEGKNLATRLTKSFNLISKAAKTIIGGVVVRTITNSLKTIAAATADFGDAIDKNSQVLGMSRKAYQQWDYILKMTVRDGSADMLTRSMRTLNSAILEGSEDTKKAIKSMGGDFAMLKSMDMEHQFDYLVNLFQKMPKSGEKMELAKTLFGQNGTELLPLLNTTTADMYTLLDEAQKLGIFMTDEGVDASVNYGDAITTMKAAFTAFKNDLVTDIMPTLTEKIQEITAWAGEIKAAYEEEGFKGIFKKLGSDIGDALSKIWLDIRANLSWGKLKQVGEDIIKKVEEGIGQIKVNLAERLGITDKNGDPLPPENISWGQIGGAILQAIADGIGNLKVNIAEHLGITSKDGTPLSPENVTWLDIGAQILANIKDGFGTLKVNIAARLGITDESGKPLDPENVTWGDIGGAILGRIRDGMSTLKINLAAKLGIANEDGSPLEPGSVSWGDIGQAVLGRIKDGIDNFKVNLAEHLGLTDESGNPLDPENVTWAGIGAEILDRIKGGIGKVKINLAAFLGITDEDGNPLNPEDTTWGEIGSALLGKIADGIGTIKVNLAKKLGLVNDDGQPADPENTTWAGIGGALLDKIKSGLSTSAVNLATLLGITNESNQVPDTWSELGKELVNKMFNFLGTGGGFLKKLILGGEFNDSSTWSDVADKVFGWIEEALAGKDLIGTLFERAADKAGGIITFVGKILGAVSDWIGQHSDKLVGTLTTVLKSVIGVAGDLLTEIVPVLVKLLTNPQLLESIGTLAGEVLAQIIKLLSDPATYEALVKAIVAVVNGVKEALTENIVEPILEDVANGKSTTAGRKIVTLAALSSGYVTKKEAEPFGGNKEAAREAQAEFVQENGIFGINKGTFSAIGAGIQKTWEDVKDAAVMGAAVVDTAFTKAGDLLGAGLEWASEKTDEAAAALASAIAAAATSVWNAIGGGGGGGGGSPYLGYGAEENAHPYVRPHAKGLWYVPYDGYIAELHRGERIQTASQARHDNGGGASAQEIAGAVKQAVTEALSGLAMVLNDKTVGKVFGDSTSRRVHRNIDIKDGQYAYGHGR